MPSTLDARPADYPDFNHRQPIETQQDGQEFSSTNVESLLYDFGASELLARYKRDGADAIYQYPDFPASTWQALAEADSKGRYINLNVKGIYNFNRLRISRWPDNQRGRSIDRPEARWFVSHGITVDKDAAHPHL